MSMRHALDVAIAVLCAIILVVITSNDIGEWITGFPIFTFGVLHEAMLR